MSDISILHECFGGDGVSFLRGEGGLTRMTIENRFAQAELYLHGAHVVAWRPQGQHPVLWIGSRSAYAEGYPIRGGIPICAPWFGKHARDPALPIHGFVRLREWTVERVVRESDGRTRVVLSYVSDPGTLAMWPTPFRAEYDVLVGPTLELELAVTNRSQGVMEMTQALHPYFRVGDVRRCTVLGLQGREFLDNTRGLSRNRQDAQGLTFTGRTDRVYLGTDSECLLDDPMLKRRIILEKSGASATVVWNPWNDPAAPPDLAPGEWPGFLCVEPANPGAGKARIPAGATHRLRATIRVAPRG
jgi:glucose-6-phosphate 1-epimerase